MEVSGRDAMLVEVPVYLTQREIDDINAYMAEHAGQTDALGISSLMYRVTMDEIHR